MATPSTTPKKPRSAKVSTAEAPAAPAPRGTTRALDHLADAAGLAFVREGFAFTPEQDVLFALGWPHLRWLVDGHPDDESPSDETILRLGSQAGAYGTHWPRGMAARYVRGFAERSQRVVSPNKARALTVLQDASPITEAEAPELLGRMFGEERSVGDREAQHFVLLLEAMHGPTALAGWATAAFESMGAVPPRDEEVCTLAEILGLVLLRVPAALAETTRERLRSVAARLPEGTLRASLTSAIGGAAAARARGLHPSFYLHATDDPSAVIASATAGKHLVGNHLASVRLAFLGGAPVLQAVAPHWKRMQYEYAVAELAEGLAEIRLPEAVELLAVLATQSKVKKLATSLLRLRASYARPILEAAAARPEGEPYAKAVMLLAKA